MRRSRKRISLARSILLLAALSSGGATTLRACECLRIGPACQAAWTNGAVVFLGKVVRVSVRVERIERSSILQKRVTFQVAENFNGGSSRTIEVATGFGGGDCGFPFRKGTNTWCTRRIVQGQARYKPESVPALPPRRVRQRISPICEVS